MASPLSCSRHPRRRAAAHRRPPRTPLLPRLSYRSRRTATTGATATARAAHAASGGPRRGTGLVRALLRRPAAAAAGTIVALVTLLAGTPGTAAAAPGSGHAPAHPEHDWMGSSIAAHEGRTSTTPAPAHPEHDWMGSSIAAHEGRTSTTPAPAHPEHDWMGSSIAAHEGRTRNSPAAVRATSVPQTPGFDVSNWQGTVDWPAAYAKGARFAYIKATEGTTYRDAQFNANYVNSYNAGFIRGAYHFARPDSSSGAAQADYFVAHGGNWSRDGQTLPPLLDIEYPDGAACYGLSQSAMRSWIASFVNRVYALTTRWATIYTTTDWWTKCTGNTAMFSAHDPLFIARYASTPGPLPAGWPFYTFWQHADSGAFPGDQDVFNGPLSGVRNLANNT